LRFMTIWALPENIEDVLPAEARQLERLRRIALDGFVAHGYELVIPPLLEYVESLLSGVGHDVDLATFKLVDQLSGRMMGIRADTTPQVARIDAHVLNRTGVTRLCYADSVLHARPSGLGKSRQPFQIGAELYGHAGLDADLEVQQLMLDTLAAFGVNGVRLDIGQPSIFRALADAAELKADERERLFSAVTGKDVATLTRFAATRNGAAQVACSALARLPQLYGEIDPQQPGQSNVLLKARKQLPATAVISGALDQIALVATHFAGQGIAVSVDLGELGGFNYESGIAFAAFAPGASEAIARGGRYDDIGRVFGRARPATGFSMDLKSLLPLAATTAEEPRRILAPKQPDADARRAMAALRAQGEIVVAQLVDADALSGVAGETSHLLKRIDGQWQVVKKESNG
jgi:ATP phosphoribosyltransferase regulatory subunit